MKLVFVSNYYNHHQAALCRALNARTESFWFVATSQMRQERRDLGYEELALPDFVIQAHLNEENRKRAQNLIDSADVVIAGSAPEWMLRSRIRAGKVLFRYAERPLKQQVGFIKYLELFVKGHIKNPPGKPIYLLCASAYAAADTDRLGLFRNAAFRWGYFPETEVVGDIRNVLLEKKKNMILWCGRLLEWKHPELGLETARRLKDDGYDFTMVFVGTGELHTRLMNQAKEWDLENHVCFPGSMKPQQVREYMKTAGIFLATSDRQEGWGAVLNEAMGNGCAVVASHEMGAAPFLIRNGENGIIFPSGNGDVLYQRVQELLDCPDLQTKLGRQAYETVKGEWHPESAAERFCCLASRILEGEKTPDLFENGPCSIAPLLQDDWM